MPKSSTYLTSQRRTGTSCFAVPILSHARALAQKREIRYTCSTTEYRNGEWTGTASGGHNTEYSMSERKGKHRPRLPSRSKSRLVKQLWEWATQEMMYATNEKDSLNQEDMQM